MVMPQEREQEEPFVQISTEKAPPIHLGRRIGTVKADWKLPWLVGILVLSIFIIVVGSALGMLLFGWVFLVCGLLFYWTIIHVPAFDRGRASAITMLHRMGKHWFRGITRYNWYLSLDPDIGEAFGLTNARREPPRPIKALGKIRFKPHYIETGRGSGAQKKVLGTAEDFRIHTLTGTLRVTTESQYSVDASTRHRRSRAYAHLLDTIAQGDYHRFVWQSTTLLGENHDPAAYLEEIQQDSRLSQTEAPNRDVLLRWIAQNSNESVVNETTMSLSVYLPSIRREAKLTDQRGYDYGMVLERRLREFYASVIGRGGGQSSIGLSSATLLSYNDLVLLNLLRLDPVFAQPLWQQWSRPRDSDRLLDERLAWPDEGDFSSKTMCRLGETFHLGFYVDEFGEAGMRQDAFWEGIVEVPVPKTVTVVFQMIPRAEARKKVERHTTLFKSANIDRSRDSSRVTEAQAQAEREAVELERELAESVGHVGRVRCYIDVTGDTPEHAQAHARILSTAVTTMTPFVIRPLGTRQLKGIDAVLPLTRGLR